MMSEPTWDKNSTIDDLTAIKEQLNAIDTGELNGGQKHDLADQLNAISVAILKLRAAKLKQLTDAGQKQAVDVQAAAGKLKLDLDSAQNAVEMINKVSAGLDVISKFVTLVSR